MRRLTIPAILLCVFAVVCVAQQRSRVSQLKVIQLAEPKLTSSVSLEQALAQRRSVRDFARRQLDLSQIGQLAWAGQGITKKERGFRTAPSAGALYPIELYFATHESLFVYRPQGHSLEEVLNRDIRARLSVAALNQRAVAGAGCDIVIAGSVKKLARKYGKKARRYMLLEAGHIAQNIHLQAVSLGLGSVPIGAFDISQVRKVCRLPKAFEPLYIISVGYPAVQAPKETVEEKRPVPQLQKRITKKVVLIVARENFRDEELFQTRGVLAEAGVETVVASTKRGAIRGMLGGVGRAEVLVSELNVDDYDGVIFVGGIGAKEYFNNRMALSIARQAKEKGKVLGAICIAPTILANAGVLKGLRATSYPSQQGNLIRAGAQYTGNAVERDGLVITGIGPEAATMFGKAISDALVGRY